MTPIQQKSSPSAKLISLGRNTRRQAKIIPGRSAIDHKLIGRHAKEIVGLISEPAQVSQPFGPDQKTEIMREMPFRPDVPGRHDQEKNQHIFPPQQSAETNPGFAIKNREQDKNNSGVNHAEQTFR